MRLAKWRQGSEDTQERLMDVVQSERRRLAASYLRRERPGHTPLRVAGCRIPRADSTSTS